ncbi:MAG TPA: GDP-mannose 4,6-dehydratase [Syntrophales bacterium]|nr:GDP-mannose 4,6-dehydratase [Syntrophales bacterium]
MSGSARGEMSESPAVLITGGAGFIGTNLSARLLALGEKVIVYDSLVRKGARRNLEWLAKRFGAGLDVEIADVRDAEKLRNAVQRADFVFHFAAQVAVTTSVHEPLFDFQQNLLGTLNLLEAVRSIGNPPPLIFTSTNKVYGPLDNLALQGNGTRYEPQDLQVLIHGINEDSPLDFHSPYGCSKGSADQYVLGYARIYGLQAAVFRMSCIYGPHQYGTEDQGWVAHFLICALTGKPVSIYGNGLQVRDILFVNDLVEAFLLARASMERLSGQAFNIGGGAANTISLLEMMDLISEIHGRIPETRREDSRPGDQGYYSSDFRKFRKATGWQPKTGIGPGVRALYDWLAGNYPRIGTSLVRETGVR